MLGALKPILARVGLYRYARIAHDRVMPSARRRFERDLALYRAFVRHGALVFDVGANIGDKCAAFLALGARVVALEPDPRAFRELAARFSGPSFLALPCAAGAAAGRATFYASRRNAALSSLSGERRANAEEQVVDVTTLDALIATYGAPDFCKVDVEGSERDVFAGLATPLAGLSFEYHATERNLADTRACLERLEALCPMEYNVSTQETSRLRLASWLHASELAALLESRRADPSWFYGDVFARRRRD